MEKFRELNYLELENVNGGFVPLVIWGVTYTASQVAAASGACFLAGFAGGIAIGAAVN